MSQCLKNNRALWLAIGVVVGMASGNLLPNTPLHASATHGDDSFALCTAEVETGIEAVVFLDGLTGDLRGAVLNISTQKFAFGYERLGINKDFGPEAAGRAPKYRLVSGLAQIRPTAGGGRLGRSVIYVCEATSGAVAAYGMPVPTGAGASPKMAFVPLDVAKLRVAAIRPGS